MEAKLDHLMGWKLGLIMGFLILLFILQGSQLSFATGTEEGSGSNFLTRSAHSVADSLRNSFDKEALRKVIPSFDVARMLKDLTMGNFPIKLKDIQKTILGLFFDEFFEMGALVAKVLGILLLMSLIHHLKSSFESQKIREIAYYCGYLVMSMMLYHVIVQGMEMTRNLVKNASSFIYAIFPVLMGLMVSSGQVASSILIKPFYISSMVFLFALLEKVILPMLLFQAAISFVANFTDKISIRSMGALNKSIAMWLMGGFLTLFTAVLSLQGSLGFSIDNVTAKTTKFSLNTFVPLAGKYISDASETVIACSMLLKNSAGVLATIILVGICLTPLIKASAMSLLFKLLTIFAEILEEKKFANLFNDISHIFMVLTGIIATLVLIFYVSISFVLGSIKPF